MIETVWHESICTGMKNSLLIKCRPGRLNWLSLGTCWVSTNQKQQVMKRSRHTQHSVIEDSCLLGCHQHEGPEGHPHTGLTPDNQLHPVLLQAGVWSPSLQNSQITVECVRTGGAGRAGKQDKVKRTIYMGWFLKCNSLSVAFWLLL